MHLALLSGQEDSYRNHGMTQSAYHTWDKLSLLCGLVTNAVIARYFTTVTVMHNVHHSTIYAAVVCMSMQALLLLAMLLHPAAYCRVRTHCYFLQRFLRLGIVIGAYWFSDDEGPSGSKSCLIYKPVRDKHTDMRALASTLLVEPLLSICHTVYHYLPWKMHVFYAAFRTAVDLRYVVPVLAHMVPVDQLESLCKSMIHYSLKLLSAGAADSQTITHDLCSKGGTYSHFLPAFMLLTIGTLVPSLITYWLELRTKLQYLRVAFPGQAHLLPGSMALRVLLLTQLQVGCVLCMAIAQLQAWLRTGSSNSNSC
jgi:hypothetical protein